VIEDLFTPMHLLVLFAIVFFLFGAKRLPDLGKSMGRGIREFRSGIAGLSDAEPEQLDKPAEAPVVAASTGAVAASSEAVATTAEAAPVATAETAAATTAETAAPVATAAPGTAHEGVASAATVPVDEIVDPGDVTIVDEPVDVTPIETDEAIIVDGEAVASVTDERAVS
jgi:sec-independent protein translocase protein TatA